MTNDDTPRFETVIGFSHEPKDGIVLRFEPGSVVEGVPVENCRALAEAGVLREIASKVKPVTAKSRAKNAKAA